MPKYLVKMLIEIGKEKKNFESTVEAKKFEDAERIAIKEMYAGLDKEQLRSAQVSRIEHSRVKPEKVKVVSKQSMRKGKNATTIS
jgi:hypothetical protein